MKLSPSPDIKEFNWIWINWLSLLPNYITNSEYRNFASVSTATTIDKEVVLLVDTTAGAITITLPPAASNEGRCYYIKDTVAGANAVTIDGNASETIDGSTTLVLATARGTAKLISDGANWHRISN